MAEHGQPAWQALCGRSGGGHRGGRGRVGVGVHVGVAVGRLTAAAAAARVARLGRVPVPARGSDPLHLSTELRRGRGRLFLAVEHRGARQGRRGRGRIVGREHGQWWHPVGSGRGRPGARGCTVLDGAGGSGGRDAVLLLLLRLIQVVDEVASWSVGAESHRMIGPAQVCLVLGMSRHCPHLVVAVGELALLTVLARPVLLVRATQLRLVTACVHLGAARRGRGRGRGRG